MNTIKIAVIGLGYVGLPLARLLATKYSVVGFDLNETRINELNSGIDSSLEVDNATLQSVLVKSNSEEKGFYCSTDFNDLKGCNYYIITVPTPVDKNNRPNLSSLFEASKTVAHILKKGDVVI